MLLILIRKIESLVKGVYPNTASRTELILLLEKLLTDPVLIDYHISVRALIRLLPPRASSMIKISAQTLAAKLLPILKLRHCARTRLTNPLPCDKTLHQYIQLHKTEQLLLDNAHVLYAIVFANGADIVLKFGYSFRLGLRLEQLKHFFGTEIYVIGVKRVAAESCEKDFHRFLRKRFPSNIYQMQVKGKDMRETYLYSDQLMIEYNDFESARLEDNEVRKLELLLALSQEETKRAEIARDMRLAEIQLEMAKLRQTILI